MKHLILIGLPGSGKTTVGRLAARRLGLPFSDSDVRIVERCHSDISTIFAQRGEEAFRDEESRTLRELCGQPSQVIATGGGAVLRRENRELLMRSGLVVLLDTPPEEIESRITADGRPLLLCNSLAQLWQQRREQYRACAHAVLQNRGVESCVDQLVALWEEQYA